MDLTSLNIPTVLFILAIGTVAGVVEGIKRLFDKDWKVAAVIGASGVIGGLLGLILPFNAEIGMSIVTGVVIGFSATGYVTIIQNFGKDM